MRKSCRAWTALLRLLADDPRVLAAWMNWCLTRGLTPARLRRVQQSPDSGDAVSFEAAVSRDTGEALATLDVVVRDQLGLPFPVVSALLLDNFRLWARDIATGPRPQRVLVLEPDAEAKRTMPIGRKPRTTLERDVLWYYRARVKQPPDLITTITAEWQQDDPAARVEPHSTVSKAIARVHDWLAGLVLVRPPT